MDGTTSGQTKRKRQKTSQLAVAGDDEDEFDLNLNDREDDESEVVPDKKRKRAGKKKGGAESDNATRNQADQPAERKKKRKKEAVQAGVEGSTHQSTEIELDDSEKRELQTRRAEKLAAKALKLKELKQQRKAKLPSSGFEKARAAAAGIATAEVEKQAEELFSSFSTATGASEVETSGLKEASMVALGSKGRLEDRVCGFWKSWKQELGSASKGSPEGSPKVLLVSASAVAANNLSKQFPRLGRGCRIGKLFAKHFKVEEQQKDLARVVNIATGTPNRLHKLADLGSLKFRCLKLLILDVAVDVKQRTILDMPEVRSDLWQFFKRHIQELVVLGTTKIALVDSSKL